VLLCGLLLIFWGKRTVGSIEVLRSDGDEADDVLWAHRRLHRGPSGSGGGTGLSTLLRGLKAYSILPLLPWRMMAGLLGGCGGKLECCRGDILNYGGTGR